MVGGVKKCSTTKRQLRHYNKRERDALILKDELMNSTEALSRLANEQINHAVWNKLYRSKVWSTQRFPEGRVAEDVFTTFKVINDSNLIMTISDSAVYYRVRHGSISDTRSYKNVNDWFTAWIEWERFVSENIPVIFSTEQLKKLQERITYESVFQWARIPIKDSNHNRIVKRQIFERIKSLYSKEWSLKTRFALIMLQWFPHLLRFVISIYSYSRREYF